jgi:hypothetical protein
MVIIPDSVAVAHGLSFTVGQITWITGVNSFTTTARGGADSIYVDHVFIGYGSNHAGYGFNHSSNGSDHVDNSSTTSLLQKEDDRQR